MKLGVLSDTHDEVNNFEIALEAYRQQGITQVIHCGDMTTAGAAKSLEGFEVIYVDGNMDQGLAEIYRTLRDLNPHSVVLPTYEGEIGGVSIGVTHGDNENELRRLVDSGKHHYVFHGHTHRRRDETQGSTRIFNPGALGGLQFESWSYSIVDLDTGEATIIELPNR
ncbi:MAG: MJ0936 family phosphodiesterase [Anaerolineae bacterium]|nr:MAG: MJ0936 family phosphodiesterase [Anaerolineae bacterium]